MANLVRGADGIWSCLDSRSVYNHRRAASALYQASLRHQLARAGLRLRWSVRSDGLGDVVGVPRAAIEACSTRQQAVLAASAGVTPPTMAVRAVAAGLTRRLGATSSESWEQRAADGGLDRRLCAELLARSPVDRSPEMVIPDGLHGLVEERLSSSLSTFGHADCVGLAAPLLVEGASGTAIEQWADDFLTKSVPATDRAWVTPILRRREEQLAGLVASRSAHAGLARPASVARSLADRPGLGPTARRAVETLTSSGAAVERLGYRPFLAQAAVLEAAHAAWVASGHRVSVVASTPRSVDRWAALCGLPEQAQFRRPGSVVVVDNADRLCTAELHGIIADGTSRLAKVILVEGGTGPAPRQHVGPAFNRLRALLPAVDPGTTVATFGPSAPVRGGFDQTVAVASTSQDALNALVADWAKVRTGSRPPVMVALGAEEAEALNSLARQLLAGRGRLHGPGVTVDGREWRAGDELRVLRRHPLFGRAPGRNTRRRHRRRPGQRHRDHSLALGPDDRGGNRSPSSPSHLRLRHDTGLPPPLGPGSGALPRGPRRPSVAGARPTQALPRGPPTDRAGRAVGTDRRPGHRTGDHAIGRRRPGHGARRQPAARPPPVGNRRAGRHQRLPGMAARLPRREAGRARRPVGGIRPSGCGPEQRRLDEERAWLQARGRPSELIDERAQALAAAAAARRRWLDQHAAELGEWVGVDAAMVLRGDLLTMGSEARPSRVVEAELGPLPLDEGQRGPWRRAARAIECYRDRWAIADEPGSWRRPEPGTGIDPGQRHDLAYAVAAVRAISRGHALSLGEPVSRGPPGTGHPTGVELSSEVGPRSAELSPRRRPCTMTPSHPPLQPGFEATSRVGRRAALDPQSRTRRCGRLHRGGQDRRARWSGRLHRKSPVVLAGRRGQLEVVSIVAFVAALQGRLLAAGDVHVGISALTGITLAGTSIQNSLPGGVVFSTVWAFRQYNRRGADDVLSGWTLLATGTLSLIALVVLAGAGLAAANNTGHDFDLFGDIAAMVVLTAVVLFAWTRREAILRSLIRPLGLIRRAIGHPKASPRLLIQAVIDRMAAVTPRPADSGVSAAGPSPSGSSTPPAWSSPSSWWARRSPGGRCLWPTRPVSWPPTFRSRRAALEWSRAASPSPWSPTAGRRRPPSRPCWSTG